MKIVVIGGSGLLGYTTLETLKDYEVLAFSLPNYPKDLIIPTNTTLILKDYTKLSDEELLSYLDGAYGLIFAAGIDERVEGPPPIYDLYEKVNITPLKRLLELSKKAKLRSVVICGSYFSYFDRLWPKLKLYQTHPYIRSRVDQANMALSLADENFSVSVVELPYIFGTLEHREPVWTILADILLKQKRRTLYTKGGTTMITKRQAAQALIGALFLEKSGTYPIGFYNMTYLDFLPIVHEGLGIDRPIYIVPTCLFKWYAKHLERKNKKANIESGLKLSQFPKLQSKNLFIDRKIAVSLGISEDTIKDEIIASMKLSKKALKQNDLTKMSY